MKEVVFIPLKKDWVWTNRILDSMNVEGISFKIFEPKNGKLGLVLNTLKVVSYVYRQGPRNVKVLVSFASTNGYLLSFFPFIKYTVLILGSDLLLPQKSVIKRSKRAIKNSNYFYVSSAKDFLHRKFPFLTSSSQIYEWGLSNSDIKKLSLHPIKKINTVNVSGVRHVRPHYCSLETISVMHKLCNKLNNIHLQHFIGNFDSDELKFYNNKKGSLKIEFIENLPRDIFLERLSSTHIGISLTKSDLYGGPILELLALGSYVVVDNEHPILEVSRKYSLSHIIPLNELEKKIDKMDFSSSAILKRREIAQPFLKKIIFENSMKELINEFL